MGSEPVAQLGEEPRRRNHLWGYGPGEVQRCKRRSCDAQRRYSVGDYVYRSKRQQVTPWPGWTLRRPACAGPR